LRCVRRRSSSRLPGQSQPEEDHHGYFANSPVNRGKAELGHPPMLTDHEPVEPTTPRLSVYTANESSCSAEEYSVYRKHMDTRERLTDDEQQVTAADIARLAGVTRAAVSNWRRRHDDFPSPTRAPASSPLLPPPPRNSSSPPPPSPASPQPPAPRSPTAAAATTTSPPPPAAPPPVPCSRSHRSAPGSNTRTRAQRSPPKYGCGTPCAVTTPEAPWPDWPTWPNTSSTTPFVGSATKPPQWPAPWPRRPHPNR